MASSKRKRRNSDKGVFHLPLNVKKSIDMQFEKKFTYSKHTENDSTDSFRLQTNSTSLNSQWEVEKYIKFKNELNELKNNLNDKDMISWHEHTRLVNLAGNISSEIRRSMRPELCTQAWCKFYEIASTYLAIDVALPYTSVHLCEAPGAFVTSLNQFLQTQGFKSEWNWVATTLNPYYEGNNIGQMIDDDRFIRYTQDNWYFGEDGTGNLMTMGNLVGLRKLVKHCKVDLVTADGSIDCQWNPAEQEAVVSRLQHCEALAALHILSPGGTFILKMFTLLECQSISLMYLLNCVFNQVHVFKPCTSKGGNSEVYVVCLEYKGREVLGDSLANWTAIYFGEEEPTGCLFPKLDIPQAFFNQHDMCTEFFKDCQMTAIQRNLDLYGDLSDEERSRLYVEKDYCMDCFFTHYQITRLDSAARIMKFSKKNIRLEKGFKPSLFAEKATLEGKFTGSFQDRQRLGQLPWEQKIVNFETYEDDVEREDNSLWIQWVGGELSAADMDKMAAIRGKPVDRIQSSQFCHGFYIARTVEILENVKWLGEERARDETFDRSVAEKLFKILQSIHGETASSIVKRDGDESTLTQNEHNKQTKECNENQSTEDAQMTGSVCDPGPCTDETVCRNCGKGYDRKTQTVDECVREDCKMETEENIPKTFSCVHVKKGSSVFKILEEMCAQQPCASPSVFLYTVIPATTEMQYEVMYQKDLCEAVLSVFKTCPIGASVVLELGTCLSRVTAGLVYFLYRCFHEIGFVHHHGNGMVRHLVCVSFKHCPVRVQQYLEACLHVDNNQSNDLLEIVPINSLLDDPDFYSFLHISNTNLLQSFITTVIQIDRRSRSTAS